DVSAALGTAGFDRAVHFGVGGADQHSRGTRSASGTARRDAPAAVHAPARGAEMDFSPAMAHAGGPHRSLVVDGQGVGVAVGFEFHGGGFDAPVVENPGAAASVAPGPHVDALAIEALSGGDQDFAAR